MNETVLLTGISGWIAKHTAIELLKSGYKVLGTVRDSSLIEQTKKTINEYAKLVMRVLGVDLKIKYINKNLNGTLRKKLDLNLASRYGWRAKTPIELGLRLTINDYLKKKLKSLV